MAIADDSVWVSQKFFRITGDDPRFVNAERLAALAYARPEAAFKASGDHQKSARCIPQRLPRNHQWAAILVSTSGEASTVTALLPQHALNAFGPTYYWQIRVTADTAQLRSSNVWGNIPDKGVYDAIKACGLSASR